MQRVRGILSGILVGLPVATFVVVWLHGVGEVAVAAGTGVGGAVALIVGTRSDAHEAAADSAWRLAAPDLPPTSDRRALEASQASIPGPRHSPVGEEPSLAGGASGPGDEVAASGS